MIPSLRIKETGDPFSLFHVLARFVVRLRSQTKCDCADIRLWIGRARQLWSSNNNSTAYKSDTAGFIGGVFYNFPIQSRLTAGVDVRGSLGFGDRGGALATAALRIGFVPERVVLRPYFLLGGGVVTSTFNLGQITGPATQGLAAHSTRVTSGGVEFAGGLDVRLNDSFDLRAVELGAVAGGSGRSVGSAFLDAGLVWHLHKRFHKS